MKKHAYAALLRQLPQPTVIAELSWRVVHCWIAPRSASHEAPTIGTVYRNAMQHHVQRHTSLQRQHSRTVAFAAVDRVYVRRLV